MGREIKRVSFSFNWSLHQVWKGYINPYSSQKCKACDGSGYNKKTKEIFDAWYDFEGTGKKWCHNITQDEVDVLIKENRLTDFTHDFVKSNGWVKKEPLPNVTAEMVNEWSKHGFGHDAINHCICVEARARRLGVWGYCEVCNGEGEIWFNDEIKKKNDEWYDKEKYEPPKGKGWELWETVSEGSPISPVFKTAKAFIQYLIQEGHSEKAAKAFIKQKWVMSGMLANGKFKRNIHCLDI